MKTIFALWFALCLSVGAALQGPAWLASATKAAAGGGPTEALVVTNAWKGSASTSNDPVSVSGYSAGRTLVAALVGYQDSEINHRISDNVNKDTGWVKIKGTNGTGSINISMWYKLNVPAGLTTVTGIVGAAGTYPTLIVHELAGVSGFTSTECGATNSGASTSMSTMPVLNGTSPSIFIAFASNDAGGNPATWDINAVGTVGTWALFNSTASQELNGSANTTCSCPYIRVTSGTTEVHKWDSGNTPGPAIIACFH